MPNSVVASTDCHASRLLELAEKVELATNEVGDESGALIQVANLQGPVELVLLPLSSLDLLPTLSEMIVSSHWEAMGVLSTGNAKRILVEGGVERMGLARSVVLCDRNENFASVLRVGGETPISRLDHGVESPTGRIVDALRRTLCLPTLPPSISPSHLIALLWVQRVFVNATNPLHGRQVGVPLINQLRPVFWPSWHQIRNLCLRGQMGELGISKSLAAWMDVGMFSRWAFINLPELPELLKDLEELLSEGDLTYFRAELVKVLKD